MSLLGSHCAWRLDRESDDEAGQIVLLRCPVAKASCLCATWWAGSTTAWSLGGVLRLGSVWKFERCDNFKAPLEKTGDTNDDDMVSVVCL